MATGTISNTPDRLLWAATPNNYGGDWDGWEAVSHYFWRVYVYITAQADDTMCLLIDQWTFISIFVDTTNGNQYGIRYYLDPSSYSQNIIYQIRTQDPGWLISSSTYVSWGGDNYYNICYCYLQYIRLYLNWIVGLQEEMINLALMDDSTGNFKRKCSSSYFFDVALFRFYFASDASVNSNQTFIVDSILDSLDDSLIGL